MNMLTKRPAFGLMLTTLLSVAVSGCFAVKLNNESTGSDSTPIIVSSTPPGVKISTLAGGIYGGGFWDGVGTEARPLRAAAAYADCVVCDRPDAGVGIASEG